MFKNIFRSCITFTAIVAMFLLLILLNVKIWNKVSHNKNTEAELRHELKLQQDSLIKEKASIAQKRKHVDSLKRGSSEMIEEAARDSFGMIGEGETFFDFRGSADQ